MLCVVLNVLCRVVFLIQNIYIFCSCEDDFFEDREEFLYGILELDISNSDCFLFQLLVYGVLVFFLGLDFYYGCVIVVVRYGRGRVVVIGYKVLFIVGKLGFFLFNVVRWLVRGQIGKVGVNTKLKNLCVFLSEYGLKCSLEFYLIGDLCVYCCVVYSDKEVKQLQEFVVEGGGLLIGGQVWWWVFQNLGRFVLVGFFGNIIFNCFGFSIFVFIFYSGCFFVLIFEIRSYYFRKVLFEFQVVLNQGDRILEKSWLVKVGVDGVVFLQIFVEGVFAYIFLYRFLRKMLCLLGFFVVSSENLVVGDFCEVVVFCLVIELVYFGIDCFQLVQGFGIWICSFSLIFFEYFIIVEICVSNLGKERGESVQGIGIWGKRVLRDIVGIEVQLGQFYFLLGIFRKMGFEVLFMVQKG